MTNRVRKLREENKITQGTLAKVLGIAQNTLSYWEKGTYDIDSISLHRIADYFNVSIDYILCRDEVPSHKKKSQSDGVWIPVLGHVAAGIPIEAVEDILDYEEISQAMASQGEHFALKIKGDSMEPRIKDGDVVIVRKQSDVENGDIAVVLVNGDEATVKRIKKRPEGLMLIPSNQSYEPMFYTNEDIAKLPVTILGRVVELRAKF